MSGEHKVIVLTERVYIGQLERASPMNYNYTLPSIFIGLSIAIIQPQAAQAISCSKEVDTIAEKITVLIDSKAPGSGVIIKREGNTYTVLTAYHVVKQPNLKFKPSSS